MNDPICPVCGKSKLDPGHQTHVVEMASATDEPLAFLFNVQSFFDKPSAVARHMALALHEIHTHFPDKRFKVIPIRSRTQRYGGETMSETFPVQFAIIED